MSHVHALTATAALLVLATSAAAQRKPDPAAEVPVDRYAIDYHQFRRAYQARHEPTVLVLCGWATGQHQAPPQSVGLFNLDTSGLTFQLKSALEQVLNDPRVDLDLVNFNALRSANRRLRDVLELSREKEAMELLANDLSAELVLVVRLLDADPSGAPRRLTFEAFDLARGRTITTFPFSWELDDTTWDVKRYAQAIGSRFVADYVVRTGNPQRYTVRVFGLPAEPVWMQAIRRTIKSMPGIVSVRPRSIAAVKDQESAATFEVRYGGDFLDLASELAVYLDRAEGLSFETIDLTGTTISLRGRMRVPQTTAVTVAGCGELILARTPAGDAQRRELKAMYEQQGRPTVAVMVNRTPTAAERETAPAGTILTSETVVVIQSAGRDAVNRPPAGEPERQRAEATPALLELHARLLEEALYRRLGGELIGLARVDPQVARSRLEGGLDKSQSVFREQEFVETARRQAVGDVLILGKGAAFFNADSTRSVTYTFRAVNAADARILATASVRGKLSARLMESTVQTMADDLIAALVCEMMQSWSPPARLQVKLTNAGEHDSRAFASAVGARAADGAALHLVGGPSVADDSVALTLSYACTFEQLVRELTALGADLPYRIQIVHLTPTEAVFAIER
ncbi:MAG: hypothetical protein ACYSTY_02735 [Planctomycetota bacterium]|jgi:hypothetical protein